MEYFPVTNFHKKHTLHLTSIYENVLTMVSQKEKESKQYCWFWCFCIFFSLVSFLSSIPIATLAILAYTIPGLGYYKPLKWSQTLILPSLKPFFVLSPDLCTASLIPFSPLPELEFSRGASYLSSLESCWNAVAKLNAQCSPEHTKCLFIFVHLSPSLSQHLFCLQ